LRSHASPKYFQLKVLILEFKWNIVCEQYTQSRQRKKLFFTRLGCKWEWHLCTNVWMIWYWARSKGNMCRVLWHIAMKSKWNMCRVLWHITMKIMASIVVLFCVRVCHKRLLNVMDFSSVTNNLKPQSSVCILCNRCG
jgi:hypothetical protein